WKLASYNRPTYPEHETHRFINSGVGLDCVIACLGLILKNRCIGPGAQASPPGGQLTTTMNFSSLAENDNEEVEIKKMVAAAEVMVMVAETASLAEVENEETEIMVMVVDVTDFVYGAVQALHRFKNGARRSTNSVIISTGAVAKRLSFAGSGEGADGFWNGGSRHVKNVVTGDVSDLKMSGLFFAIGHEPATKFLDSQLELDEDGYVVTKPGTTKTSVVGVFSAGDVQDKSYRQALPAAGTGLFSKSLFTFIEKYEI
ncbi:hypothetical protein HID58_094528, partial [Brassica napus]